MAVLAVKNEEALMGAVAYAETKGVRMAVFYEPDPAEEGGSPMGYAAAASEPIQGELRKTFKKWGLWKPPLVSTSSN
jgi:hypothetical protein